MIKQFKAWDKNKKIFIEEFLMNKNGEVVEISTEHPPFCKNVEAENFQIIQSLGLKDSQGKEIFEFDILEGIDHYPGNFDSPPEDDYQRVIPEYDDEEGIWKFKDVFIGEFFQFEDLVPNIKIIGSSLQHDPEIFGMEDGEGKDLKPFPGPLEIIIPEEQK